MIRRDRHINIVLAAICFLLPLAAYVTTLAPTLSWRNEGRDGGDLMSAICTLGIPHPPGYPLYVCLGRAFTLLPFGDIAYRVNLMSAAFAAGAVVTAFLTAQALARAYTSPSTPSPVEIGPQPLPACRRAEGAGMESAGPWASLAALTGALAFAFSLTLWSQATIAEVYTLGAFLSGLVICLITKLPEPPKAPRACHLFALGLTAGLCLAHHLTIAIWLAAGGLWLLLLRPVWLWRPRSLALLSGGFLLGLSVYLYLPLRGAVHPAANWGAPQNLRGFFWMVTAEPYRRLFFAMPLHGALGRIPTLVSLLAQQFGWIGLAVGLGGIWVAAEADSRFLAFSLVAFLGSAAYAIGYNTVDSFVYLIPAYQVFSLWIALGASSILRTLATRRFGHHWPLSAVVAGLLLLASLVSLPAHYAVVDASGDRAAYEFAAAVFADAAPNAIILVDGDEHTFALWYFRDCVRARPDVAVLNRSLLGFDWYQEEARLLYPALSWPHPLPPADPVGAFVIANQGHHPIQLTERDARLASRFSFTPVGSLYRLEAQQ